MARRNSAQTALRWREVLRRQAESGWSIRRFCAREGIATPSFYAWRRKLREPADDDQRAARASRHGDSDREPLFVPVKLLDSAPALEIIHPLGYRIQVTGELHPAVLRQVIETLDERGSR